MRWPDLEAKQNLERERQTTKVWRLQVNQKTCFDHVTFLEIGEIEEIETSRDLEDEKGLRKVLGQETRNDTLAQKVEMWFLESRQNTKGQTSEIRVVEKPQKEPKNLKKCNLVEPSLNFVRGLDCQ